MNFWGDTLEAVVILTGNKVFLQDNVKGWKAAAKKSKANLELLFLN